MESETSSTEERHRRLRLSLVLLLYALMFTGAAANVYLTFKGSYMASAAGWLISQEGGRFFVTYISPYGPAGHLREGDEVITLNGQQLKSTLDKTDFFKTAEAGKPYKMEVRRDGQPLEVSLRTVPVSTPVWLGTFVVIVLAPAIFLLVGFAIFLLKPDDKQALLLSLSFGMVAFTPAAFVLAPVWLQVLMAVAAVVSGLLFPLFLHFCLIFPEPSALLRKWPRAEKLLYVPALLLILPGFILNAYALIAAPELIGSALLTFILKVSSAVRLAYVAIGLLLLVLKYRHASQVSRRKLRVLLAGCIIALLPVLIVESAQLFLPASAVYRATGEWHLLLVPLASIMAPLSFAYAIARHQVIPVSLIIRRSLQYLLAKNALRLLLALPVAGLVITILSNPHRTLADILLRSSVYFYLFAAVSVMLGLIFRKRLGGWIDRKFFREAYNQEKILRDLVEEVRKADSMALIARMVSEKVDSALHPENLYLFYREEERRDLSLGYSSGGSQAEMKIPEQFRLLRFMEDQGGAQDFPFPRKNNLPQTEKEWLHRLGTNLIVPMQGADGRLAGLFLLGQKKSEVPYTARDRQLLEAVADQIAIVHENVRLKERVHRDRKIKHEVLARMEGRNINLLKECPTCGACFDSSEQFCPRDRSELTLSLPVERTIDERYRLDQLIGRGGMGAVYEAMDIRLSRKVAIKILTGSMFGNREALRRFEREAQASARLSHKNVITVYDYGVLSTEGAYLVMELIAGETLGRKIKRERLLPTPEAAEVFDQILEGLEAAHSAGILHRDLKPDNILLSKSQTGTIVKILDFGLAKIVAPEAADSASPTAQFTTPGTIMGTFGYMSPEQLMGEALDERSDLFSVGVMIVEALTGTRPFTGKTYHELLINILQNPFHLQNQTPEAKRLDAVLQKCLAKDRSERFTSATLMRRELIDAIRNCPPLFPTARKPAEMDADTAIL